MNISTLSDESQSSSESQSINANDNIIDFILKGKALPLDCQLSDNDIIEYITHLSSLGVSQLTSEPLRLSEDANSIVVRTQELAFNNYKAFITTADCAKHVFSDFNSIETKLNNVIENVPQFIEKINIFSDDSKSISKRWRESSLMLSKHPQLLEVLEIPQLMDTCVRNSYYEEALQLYAYVQRINKKYGSNIPLIASVAKDVNIFRESMMNQLLKELHSNIPLPVCLKVVGYLRRMDTFTDGELRIKFLTARDSWLQSILREVPTNNPMVHILKVIETNRVNLFDIVTQYRAIFADHEPIVAYTIRYGISQTGNDRNSNDSAILQSWINFKINEFLDVLKCDLNLCVNNEFGHYYPIESIIDQCFYFGLSMSRIGADFRPQLIPILNDAILTRFKRTINDGTERFENLLQSFTLTSHTVSVNLSSSVGSDEVQHQHNDDDDALEPPASLLEFPLLAHYCNDVTMSLNEIRQTTPLALVIHLVSVLNESFRRSSDAILRYFKAEMSGLSPIELKILRRFGDDYVNDLLPFIRKCFNRICPPSVIAKKLGSSVIEYNKLSDKLGLKLEIDTITSPIRELLSFRDHSDPMESAITLRDNNN